MQLQLPGAPRRSAGIASADFDAEAAAEDMDAEGDPLTGEPDTDGLMAAAAGTQSVRMMTDAAGQRLQKALAHLGLASRREVEAWIRAGRLTVNGQPATLGMRVVAAQVRLDGRLVRQRVGSAIKVFVVHRSPGVEMRELLQQLPRSGGRRFVAVSPMPAIDGGLELVSSDGETAERLQRGVRRLTADFSVRVHGELSAEGVARVLQGTLDNGTTVKVLSCDAAGGEGSNRWYTLIAVGASGKDIRQVI